MLNILALFGKKEDSKGEIVPDRKPAPDVKKMYDRLKKKNKKPSKVVYRYLSEKNLYKLLRGYVVSVNYNGQRISLQKKESKNEKKTQKTFI